MPNPKEDYSLEVANLPKYVEPERTPATIPSFLEVDTEFTPEQFNEYTQLLNTQKEAQINELAKLGADKDKISEYSNILDTQLEGMLSGLAPQHAKPVDLYGSMDLRLKASFGNPQGLTQELGALGYKNVQYDDSGEIVAQTPKGTWVRDANKFKESIPKAAASLAGMVPELAGATIGAGLGLGGASIPGAMAGGAGGYAAKRVMGARMGTYAPENVIAPTSEMLTSGLLAGGGQALGNLGNIGLNKIAPYAEKLVSPVRKYLSKNLPKFTVFDNPEAAARLITRPYQMERALKARPKDILEIAESATSERQRLSGQAAGKIKEAKRPLLENLNVSIPTRKVITESLDEVEPLAYGPSSQGIGALSPAELEAHKALIAKYFTTPIKDEAGEVTAVLEQQSVHNLMKAYEEVNANINSWDAQNAAKMMAGESAATADTVTVKLLKNIRGRIQTILKEQSPKYAKALEEYSKLVKHTNLLTSLESPLRRQGAITSVFAPKNEAMRQAVEEALPSMAPSVLDIGAADIIKKESPIIGATRYLVPAGIGAGTAAYGTGSNNKALMYGGAGLTLATHPYAARSALLGIGKTMQRPMWENLLRTSARRGVQLAPNLYRNIKD